MPVVCCLVTETKEFNVVERHTIDSLYNIANVSQEGGARLMELIYTT
jgi:hypothetical protein